MNKGKASRSSLPSEVYRDKNTLVEVKVHRNSRNTNSSSSKRDNKSWAESLSDNDVQFDKPTKSSLAKSRPSPRKERKLEKARKEIGEKRSLQELLAELKGILEVSGVKDIYDFVAEFDQQKKNSSNQLQGSAQDDKVELERRQAEINRYKEEYALMVKQMEVSRDSVNSLELQVSNVGRMVDGYTLSFRLWI